MGPSGAVLTLCLVFFLLVLSVSGQQKPKILTMDEHHCLAQAWVADGNRFRYIYRRKTSIIPTKSYFNGEYPYVYAHSFKKGQTLHLFGKLGLKRFTAADFEVNLMGGTPVNDDNAGADVLRLAFSFNTPKGDGHEIVLNSRKKGKWYEDIAVKNPFFGGWTFLLTIHAMNSKFEVRCNGHKVNEYHYRMPLDYVTMVNTFGELLTLNLIYLGGQVMKSPLKIIFPEGALNVGDNIQFDAVPGFLNFELNFHNGNSDDVALQIKTNFESRYVEFNSRLNGVWGWAQYGKHFPFEAGKAFDMEIRWSQQSLTVYVDFQEVVTYNHRVNATDYGELHIKGSIELRSFVICANYKIPWWVGSDFVKYGGSITKLST